MDIKALRSEIKAWEHAFKKENGRNPSINDIKSQTIIAEKYKLYKKLSKLSNATNSAIYSDTNTSIHSSSITSSPSLLPPKKPAARSHYPPSEANPFSPNKIKLGLSPASGSTSSYVLSSPNPFTTPVKIRPANGTRFDQDHSPVSFFPAIASQQSQLSSKSSTIPHASIISKARKRLHGDPVTPSPQKEKKRRLMTTHDFKNESDVDDTTTNAETPFVEESPVRKPSGSKNFQSLFEDPIQNHVRRPLSVPFLFPSKQEYSHDIKPKLPVVDKPVFHGDSTPSCNRRLEERDDDSYSDANAETVMTVNSEQSNHLGISPTSRNDLPQHSLISANLPNLIPPSPPPNTTTIEPHRASLHRKKLKADPNLMDHDVNDDDETNVIEWHPPRIKHRNINYESDTDLDVELHTQGKPIDYYTAPDEVNESEETESQVEIDLPEDLRNMLVISPSSHHREEKALVKHILYGQRSRLLSGKRGEVWDVGEIDASGDDSENEDDWAGEGVPWDVADM